MRHSFVVKPSVGERLFDFFNIIFLMFLIFITIYPLLYTVFASLSDSNELTSHIGLLWRPLGTNIKAYILVMRSPNIITGYKNTTIYVFAGTAINLFLTSLGAYVLSRREFYIKKMMMFGIVFTMFFSGGIIPNYLLVKYLGMMNTMWAIIIPTAIITWNLIIMRTYFMSIPYDMEESAIIDGANDFKILIFIILPLAKPIIAVMILFYSVNHWNSWFHAMLYLRDRELLPLQIFLREILFAYAYREMGMLADEASTDYENVSRTIMYATVVISTLPILAVYPLLQKYFVKGVMIGALKG
jgi:putative aldouronate transport system permease protein